MKNIKIMVYYERYCKIAFYRVVLTTLQDPVTVFVLSFQIIIKLASRRLNLSNVNSSSNCLIVDYMEVTCSDI